MFSQSPGWKSLLAIIIRDRWLTLYSTNVDFIQPGEGPSRGLLRDCENQLLPMDHLHHHKYLLQNGQEGPPHLLRIWSRRHCMRRVHRWALLPSIYLINNVYKHPQLCVIFSCSRVLDGPRVSGGQLAFSLPADPAAHGRSSEHSSIATKWRL